MQICPWFLEETKKNKVLALAGQGKAASLARSWKKFSGWIDDPLRTPMDVAATFDHTLLHEMTHAIPAGATVDSGGGMSSYSKKPEAISSPIQAGCTTSEISFLTKVTR